MGYQKVRNAPPIRSNNGSCPDIGISPSRTGIQRAYPLYTASLRGKTIIKHQIGTSISKPWWLQSKSPEFQEQTTFPIRKCTHIGYESKLVTSKLGDYIPRMSTCIMRPRISTPSSYYKQVVAPNKLGPNPPRQPRASLPRLNALARSRTNTANGSSMKMCSYT